MSERLKKERARKISIFKMKRKIKRMDESEINLLYSTDKRKQMKENLKVCDDQVRVEDDNFKYVMDELE